MLGLKPKLKKAVADSLNQVHTKAERDYPTFGVISFERVSRGIAPPDPEVDVCDICETTEYLVHKCPDGLYRCSTCFSRAVHMPHTTQENDNVR